MPNMTIKQLRQRLQELEPAPAQMLADRTVLADALILELCGYGDSDVRRIDRDLLNPGRLFAIKDSDLQLLPGLFAALLGVFPHLSPASLGKLAAILLRYWRKRVEITPMQAAILRTMQTDRNRDWRSDALRTAVGLAWGPAREPLDEDLAILTRNGLVTQSGNTWKINDV